MNNEDDAMKIIQEIQSKIDREKVFLNGASDMRRQTNNDSVRSRLDVKIEESQKLIDFFEGKLQEMVKKRDDWQMRRLGHGVDNMSISSGSTAVASMPSSDLEVTARDHHRLPRKMAVDGLETEALMAPCSTVRSAAMVI